MLCQCCRVGDLHRSVKPEPFGFGGSNPPTGTKTQRVTDHHWIILVLQGFLGIVEERALCDHLISLLRLAGLWHLPYKQAKPWFESKRGDYFGQVLELARQRCLRSIGPKGRVGSNPSLATTKIH